MITMSEYAKRRSVLMRKIGASDIVILPAATELFRNNDTVFPFRQNSDFYYLTGFNEPDAVLLLMPSRRDGEFILFNRERNLEREVWDGPRAGQAGAKQQFKADQAYPYHMLEAMLPGLLAGRKTIHYPVGRCQAFDKTILDAVNTLRARVRRGIQAPTVFADVSPTIHEMRLFKSKEEIATIQKAIDITAHAHQSAMEACRPGMNERELEAVLSYEFKRRGAQQCAYSPIVGAGANACVLHYVRNDAKIKNGDLVLIDAGAEYENYASDITRTFPANGRFTSEQRAIYEIVLEAQLAGIKAVKPGALWDAPQTAILKVITQGLLDLGILKGKLSVLLEKQAYFPFYMHGYGHWMGLDVHDVGSYKAGERFRPLKAGMVLTVEPGIYIAANQKGVHKRWHNIGVRIEDDVLVTGKGCKVLSQGIPKTIAAIEKLMGG